MGCGCGMTCLIPLDWQRAGVWEQIHQILLNHSSADRSIRTLLVYRPVPSSGGGEQPVPARIDPNRQQHFLTDGQGVRWSPIHRGQLPDVNELLPLVDDIPPVPQGRTAPANPGQPDADRAYDSQPHRQSGARGSIPTWPASDQHGRAWGLSLGGGATCRGSQLSQAPLRPIESPVHILRLVGFNSHMYVVPMTRSFF